MRGIRLIPLIILAFISFGLIMISTEGRANAQGENLLTNPSFEGIYDSYIPETPQEVADCPINLCNTAQMPWGWKPWWVKERPTDVNPEFKPAEAIAPGNRVHSGQRASQYFSFWSTHKAGLRQTVSVPANAVVDFSIWGHAWMTESDSSLVSDYSGTPNMRIGIDPAGGSNPYNPSIVWSEYKQPFDTYQPFAVRAQAQGEAVTVFTFSAPSVNPNSPDYGFKHNDVYWDDASLTADGGAPAPPAPQPPDGGGTGNPPPAPVPQFIQGPTPTPNAEGIIYVEVQSGDSLWAISARAGLNFGEFLEINEITRDHVILSGDFLIIGFGDAADSNAEGNSAAEETERDAIEQESSVELEATATPAPTLPPPGPALAEQIIAGGTICLKAYEDLNKDTAHDDNEPLRPAVAITISSDQQVVSNYITDGETEPFCIEGLDDGSYRVTRSSLPNETLTTPGDYAVVLAGGTSVNIAFGSYLTENVLVSSTSAGGATAQLDSEPDTGEEGALVQEGDGTMSTLVIVGIVVAVLLLIGIVILVLSRGRATAQTK